MRSSLAGLITQYLIVRTQLLPGRGYASFFSAMSCNKNLVAAAIVVVDACKSVHDGVKDHEVCPYGHGAGQDNLAAITCRLHDSGNVTADDVYRLVYGRSEVEPSGNFLNFTSCIQGVVFQAKIDCHNSTFLRRSRRR